MSNLIENGSFETGTCAPGVSWCLYPAANVSSVIPPWTMVAGTQFEIDTASTFAFAPAQGKITMDLQSDAPFAIGQTIETVPGAIYAVSFQLNRNPYCGAGAKTGFVSLGGMEKAFEHSGDKWILQSFNFTASTPSSQFVIGSRQAGSCGPVIDDVQMVLKSSPPVTTTTTKATTTTSVYTATTTTVSPVITSTTTTSKPITTSDAPASKTTSNGYVVSTYLPVVTSTTSECTTTTSTKAPIPTAPGYDATEEVAPIAEPTQTGDSSYPSVDPIISGDIASSIDFTVLFSFAAYLLF